MFRRLTALQRYLVDALRRRSPSGDGRPARAASSRPAWCSSAPTASPRSSPASRRSSELLRRGLRPAGRADRARGRRLVRGRDAGRRRSADRRRAGSCWRARAAASSASSRSRRRRRRRRCSPRWRGSSDVVRDQEQAVKAALLAEALEPAEARDLLPLAARAAAFGLDFSSPPGSWSSSAARRRRPRERRGASWSPARARPASRTSPTCARTRSRCWCRAATTQVRRAGRPRSPRAWRRDRRGRAIARSPTRTTRCATPSSPPTAAGSTRSARVMRFEDFDLGTFLVSEIAPERLAPEGRRRSCPCCTRTRRCTRRSAPTSPTTSTSPRPPPRCTCTATRCATGSRAAEQVLGRSLKQPATIAAVYLALVAEAGGPNPGREFGLRHGCPPARR